ncbi:ABC-2 transporter permease [Priestia endophytica]|uniref:ABC-2 transporter permease n=1 Tax=Priestia endophytica TaxID=135735 RepID=UPI003D2859CB
MKGLILNNFYSMRDSIKLSLMIAIVANVILIATKNSTSLQIAIFLSFVLISSNAFEVLKQDSSSGWSKFELILPLARYKIVQSKYLTFLLLLVLSLLVTIGIFAVTSLFINSSEELILNFIFRGMGFVFCIASIVYPLTYILGGDKSEVIRLISMVFSLGVFGLIYFLQLKVMEKTEGFDRIFSLSFLLVSIIFFIISYVVSIITYKEKEF